MKHLVRKYSLLSLTKILIVYAWTITYIIIRKRPLFLWYFFFFTNFYDTF